MNENKIDTCTKIGEYMIRINKNFEIEDITFDGDKLTFHYRDDLDAKIMSQEQVWMDDGKKKALCNTMRAAIENTPIATYKEYLPYIGRKVKFDTSTGMKYGYLLAILPSDPFQPFLIAANDDYEPATPEVASDVIFTHYIEVDDK